MNVGKINSGSHQKSTRAQNAPVGRLVAACFVFLAFLPSVHADDAWFVSTRLASASADRTENAMNWLIVERLHRDAGNRLDWAPSTQDAFFGTHDPEKPLLVIIHGNWMTYREAQQHGSSFYRLAAKAGKHRLLVWNWPTDRIGKRIRPDAQIKARRADDQARFLASFLRKLPPGSKVCLAGFSFGARLTCGTLELLAQDGPSANGPRLRAVLLAAAMDRASLLPGRKYGNAPAVAELLIVHTNPDDETLRWYPLLYGCGGPEAIGKVGPATFGMTAEECARIRLRNVRRLVGEEHAFMKSLLGLLACRDDFEHGVLFE